MKKLSLKPDKEYQLASLDVADRVMGKNGFPASSNFTKKSKGAVVVNDGIKKKLVMRNDKLSWRNLNKKSQTGGGDKSFVEKSAKKLTGGNDIVKLMLFQQMLAKKNSKGSELAMNGGAEKSGLSIEMNQTIQTMKDKVPLQEWNEISDEVLDSFGVFYQVFREFTEISKMMCDKLMKTIKDEIYPLAKNVRAEVSSKSYGFRYNNLRKIDIEKLQLFVTKFQNVPHICNTTNNFVRTFQQIQDLIVDIDKLQHTNDFKSNLQAVIKYDGNNLTDEDLARIIAENEEDLQNLGGVKFYGQSLVNQFKQATTAAQKLQFETNTKRQLAQSKSQAHPATTEISITTVKGFRPPSALISRQPLTAEEQRAKEELEQAQKLYLEKQRKLLSLQSE